MDIKYETKIIGDGTNFPMRGHTVYCHFTGKINDGTNDG